MNTDTTTPTPTTLVLPYSAKPSAATDADGTRPALQHGHIVEEDGKRVLITSDSYMLARHIVGDDVPLGAIHPEALKRIEDREPHEVGEGQVVGRGVGWETTWRPTETKMPFVDKPAPQFNPGDARIVSVALDPRLLIRLAEALGNTHRGVKLEIPVSENGEAMPRAIRVTPYDGGAEGLLMPMRIEKPR